MPESQADAELEFALFCRAPEEEVQDAFSRLVGAVWVAGKPTANAAAWVQKARANLEEGSAAHQARLALLLGLLAETSETKTAPEVRREVRNGLPAYLSLLASDAAQPASPSALTLALLYLLAHFPEDADHVLDRTRAIELPEEDRSRFERCLAQREANDPALGRVWPSPAGWTLTEEEHARDRRWVAQLDDATVRSFWDKDTRSLLAYSGAKAYGALTVGLSSQQTAPPEAVPDAGTEQAHPAGLLGAHADVICCPSCRHRLAEEAHGARCTGCGARYAARRGYLDLTRVADGAADVIGANAPMYLPRYESLLRPSFLRVHGINWNDAISVEAEHQYLADHVRPVGGPVLDLAAGAGNWTRTLARSAGPERVIALDLATAMLDRLRITLPGVPALRGSAVELPFADASLGAVNCWNALQAMDDPESAIREVGRCLHPGGTFTLLTFQPAPDPVYRHFQTLIEECLGVRSFRPDALASALEEAGMTVREMTAPGTFLILTAVRTAQRTSVSPTT
ncbi:class I SAM-dependent methyltransferase [Streptomyces sioyaensis]|uniref:class I SAM-dependent methyltransferase n=1 Tax=Streptomyces sioyaensis TaxID=67364 RepID=UPI001F1D99D5|nr:class I SAM-dependent methyltransferase [Streptomyces sioyaensis]MCF3176319.1 class I SAM-dependent methyltransferase [Streptomyces sioyaensis]